MEISATASYLHTAGKDTIATLSMLRRVIKCLIIVLIRRMLSFSNIEALNGQLNVCSIMRRLISIFSRETNCGYLFCTLFHGNTIYAAQYFISHGEMLHGKRGKIQNFMPHF
ncbi:MAG: hypothetical protein BROFUL_03329 [Candidatus Brocadia fulgida]|uniref:Uncharacterized protein n=1 Tax=Candidatus Brocadia fulgida TaxID=380242 RepID=A0A0M2USL3_9BACT|nr:MAG: hypothetical protein BROFUL_03329 [Candidatus Brocadia fulgida]